MCLEIESLYYMCCSGVLVEEGERAKRRELFVARGHPSIPVQTTAHTNTNTITNKQNIKRRALFVAGGHPSIPVQIQNTNKRYKSQNTKYKKRRVLFVAGGHSSIPVGLKQLHTMLQH